MRKSSVRLIYPAKGIPVFSSRASSLSLLLRIVRDPLFLLYFEFSTYFPFSSILCSNRSFVKTTKEGSRTELLSVVNQLNNHERCSFILLYKSGGSLAALLSYAGTDYISISFLIPPLLQC